MNSGIVFFATDDETIIKDVQGKISASKNECKIIRETSKSIIEHLFNIFEKNVDQRINFDYEFEKGFCSIYYENISSEISEIDVNNFLDEILIGITTYNKNFEVENDVILPENYKIKINKALFDSFLKYIFLSCINSVDNYKMKINGGVNYVVNKEVTNLIVNIADKTNAKLSQNSSISKLTTERIEFVNIFMNHLLEPCNCKFRINKIDAKFTIEIHLIKTVDKR